MPSNVGSGSQIVLRAREAALRASAAQALGITASAPMPSFPGVPSVAQGLQNPLQGANGSNIRPAQPPTAAPAARPTRETMFAETENFLRGIDPFSGSLRNKSGSV